jgi:hypothetical protein
MSVCEHDRYCSGFGWAHDAQVTPAQRRELGIPRHEVSMKKAKRAMRAHRKAMRDG